MACCQRGSAWTIFSQERNSSAMIGGCTPSTARKDITARSRSETTAS
jgi:hypothetical protein